ncbi:hypothetical protein JOD69_005047 [Methylocaldum sp. RMAD-M]|nr:hypothetical protein [Methylocaldum sp. RMAD-M]
MKLCDAGYSIASYGDNGREISHNNRMQPTRLMRSVMP